MELKKESISLCETMARGTTQAMTDGDVIVPDVKPDILKILQVDGEAVITDKYIDNNRLIINGRVDYKVLYVPDRENERIKSIQTSMDFRQAVDSGGAGGDADIMAEAAAERVEFNAVNSRKLRLRAIVRIDYEICKKTEADICTGVESDTAQCLTKQMTFENLADISEHSFTVKEMLEVPSGQSSINEILKTDVVISDTEHKTVTGKIIVKGNARVCVLYTDDDNGIKFLESELPFTEVLDADGVREDTICDIDYSVLAVMSEAEPDSDGDMRVVRLDIDLCAAVRGIEMVEEEVLCDCFVPYAETECERERIKLNATTARPSAQNTIREIIEFPSNAPSASGVYNVMTNAVVTKSELSRGRLMCEGRIETYVLYLTDTAENPVYSIKKDIPFSYMIECEEAKGDETVELKAEVKHVSYNLNSSGELELRCLLSLDGRLTRQNELMNITGIEEKERPSRHGIVIYFAKDGDSVWNVAKRYAVPQDKIIKYNNLENDSVAKGAKLFIPA